MANTKKDNLTLGYGCISCSHNKDINLYKDMYKKSTERNEEHAEEGKEFFKELLNNPPTRTRCRFYDSAAGLLCEYFVERDYVKATGECPDYLEVKFEKAPVQRVRVVAEETQEEDTDGEIREVEDEENVEPTEFEDEDEEEEVLDEE
ncbi:MAG: hypothetical protein KBS81_06520 [Spirochaetales bacterium]|nr:hypothetical protein [Candidatus Physcosoma equi]